jgi:hypothetical protein
MMRELTRANAMQNARVMKYLYMTFSLGDSPVAISTISQSLGNVSYLTSDWRDIELVVVLPKVLQ